MTVSQDHTLRRPPEARKRRHASERGHVARGTQPSITHHAARRGHASEGTHASRITYHASRVTRHVSCITLNQIILLVILLISFAVRLYQLGADSLWYDEAVSAFLAGQSIFELIAHTSRDIHPPAYYLLLHFWAIVAGKSEFALAFFSLIFGVLLVALTYRVARYLANRSVATWAIWLTALSPYHLWYSQEVRMYTLGAVLGLAAVFFAIRGLRDSHTLRNKFNPPPPSRSTITANRFWLGYVVFATIGLYTLYYFAFLLIIINFLFLVYTLWPRLKRPVFFRLLLANGLVLVAYLPWLPLAWRQATNPPVPAWRSAIDFWPTILESWSALSLGQSVDPATVWPILLLILILFILGLHHLTKTSINIFSQANWLPTSLLPRPPTPLLPRSLTPLLLFAYTFGPLLLIYVLSLITPLYHVRYVFTYAPAFYIILGAGISWLAFRTRLWVALTVMSVLLGTFLFSVYQFHFNPRYRADDYRAAVRFIQTHWQPGDVILVNAGYTYPAFIYYAEFPSIERKRLVPYQQPPDKVSQPLLLQTGSVDGDPQLGWDDPRSDFYAMSASETIAALERLSNDFPRLWMLRAYDTVTDPQALIRTWLAEHTIPLEDEVFAGESNIRAQGFLLSKQPQLQGETVLFKDGMALVGWHLPTQTWSAGQPIHVRLAWMATSPPSVDYKMSLKLWAESGELVKQGDDEWPVGTLYRATAWPAGQTIYHPTQLTLPPDLPPGQYWLNVELYHPHTVQPLPRLDGRDPVVTLGPVVIK
jgi:mannosyltransferase